MSYDSYEVPDGITPLVGYRGWLVEGDTLLSCYRKVAWPVGEALNSECLRKPRGRDDRDVVLTPPSKHYWSPHLDCSCGVYALNEYPQVSQEFEGKLRPTIKPWPAEAVTGVVLGWGRIIMGTKGFRAQMAKPVALVGRPRSKGLSEVIERLAARYGLEVVDAKDVRRNQ